MRLLSSVSAAVSALMISSSVSIAPRDALGAPTAAAQPDFPATAASNSAPAVRAAGPARRTSSPDLPTSRHGGMEYRLLVRSNINDGYRVPPFSSFLGGDVVLNDRGDVAIALSAIGGEVRSGIWSSVSNSKGEQVVYLAPELTAVSDLAINAAGDFVFDLHHEDFRSVGLHVYRRATDKASRVLEAGALKSAAELAGRTGERRAPSVQFFRMPQWITDSSWGYGVKAFNDGLTYEAFGASSFARDEETSRRSRQSRHVQVTDKVLSEQSPYTYLFNPSFNAAGAFAAKVRLGDKVGQIQSRQPDKILYWAHPGARPLVVAADRDADPASRFVSFDNTVDLSSDGSVAFIATLADERRGVFRWKAGRLTEIALTETEAVSEVSYFHPVINGKGQVAFRGRDDSGRETIFLGDGSSLAKVVSEHDILPSDHGPARVDQHRDGDTVFCGGIALNDRGEVAFCAALTPPKDNQTEWGSGVYLAAPAQFTAR